MEMIMILRLMKERARMLFRFPFFGKRSNLSVNLFVIPLINIAMCIYKAVMGRYITREREYAIFFLFSNRDHFKVSIKNICTRNNKYTPPSFVCDVSSVSRRVSQFWLCVFAEKTLQSKTRARIAFTLAHLYLPFHHLLSCARAQCVCVCWTRSLIFVARVHAKRYRAGNLQNASFPTYRSYTHAHTHTLTYTISTLRSVVRHVAAARSVNSYRKLIQDNYRDETLKHINCRRMPRRTTACRFCRIAQKHIPATWIARARELLHSRFSSVILVK